MKACSGQIRRFSLSTSTVSKEKTLSLSKIPTGSGRKHASSGQNVTIFGATGFVARYLVNNLGYAGSTVTAATRGDDMSWRHLKPLCDLGKITPSYYDLRDEDSVRQAIRGADVVVNLQGKHYETKHIVPTWINWTFEQVHSEGAEKLARIAREEDVKHFVQLSTTATNGDESKMSRWALSKKRGDEAVRREFPGATIVKSNVIFGEEDRFLKWFAKQMIMYPVVPLFGEGAAQIQPVYVGDVAKALSVITEDWSFCGETVELNGPYVYTYKQVAEWVAEQIKKDVKFVDIPEKLQEPFGKFFNLFPNPRWSPELIKLLQTEQIESMDQDVLRFADLGIEPQQLERKGFNTVYMFRSGGHFSDPKSAEVIHS